MPDAVIQLLNQATYTGIMVFFDVHRYGMCRDVRVAELVHCFDANMEEIGMIAFGKTVTLFDPPREWSPEFLDSCEITETEQCKTA